LDNKVQAQMLMDSIVNRIKSKPSEMGNYTQLVQFYFTDAQVAYALQIQNGQVKSLNMFNDKQTADVSVSCKVQVLQDIFDNKLGALAALMTRKVKVDGPILAIRELRQKVLGPEHDTVKKVRE
jgi:putative sterol carrier protein